MVRRIAEILLEHAWVSRQVVERALAQHEASGMRLCSWLIDQGAIDCDTASRALGEQHGVASALERHLDRRDRSLAALLPASAAQLYTALPLGRTSAGEVLVCVRDPKPELRGILARAMKVHVVLAVAPAIKLDALVRETYGEDASEFDVDMGTQPIPVSLRLELDEVSPVDDGMPDLGTFQLVELDDTRVSKDPTQSGAITAPMPPGAAAARQQQVSASIALPRTSTLPPREPPLAAPTQQGSALIHLPPRDPSSVGMAVSRTSTLPPREPPPAPPTPPLRAESSASISLAQEPLRSPPPAIARTASSMAVARTITPTALANGTARPTREYVPLPVSLAETLIALGAARTTDDICDAAMRFIAGRWRAALLLSVEGIQAVGMRGHGVKLTADLVRSISISLEGPSILDSARSAAGKLVTRLPPGGDEIHDHLEQMLSLPRFPAAVGIAVGRVVEYLLAIGDPHASDVEAATSDLSRIATALSAAFTRLESR